MRQDAGSDDKDYVLIVGAGPTGLTMAYALATYGVPFTIVDAKLGPSSDSKGLALNIATLYGLHLLHSDHTIGRHGEKVRRLNVNYQHKRYCAIDFRHLNAPVDHFVTQPQSVTERELLSILEADDHFVEWETRVVDVTQNDYGAEVVFENHGKRRKRFYSYVVGCEGKNSLVRDKISANFTGHDYAVHFVLGDFALAKNVPSEEVYYHIFDETFFILVPIGKGICRIVVKCDGPVPSSPVRVSDITEILERYLGDGLIDSNPLWLSRAPFYMRTSDRLNRGRLFIAGDAAHLYSPIGGTGMNTGMQDAFNLAWKIGYVYRRYSKDSILATYQTERLEAILETANVTDLSTRLITGQTKSHPIIEFMAPKVKNRQFIRKVLPFRYSGLGLRYSSLVSNDSETNLISKSEVGRLDLGLAELFRRSNFRHMPARPHPVLVLIRIPSTWGEDIVNRLAPVRTYLSRYRYIVVFFIISSQSVFPLSFRLKVNEYMVYADTLFDTLSNLEMGKLRLVRPDGIVAFNGPLENVTEVCRCLDTIFDTKGKGNLNGVISIDDCLFG